MSLILQSYIIPGLTLTTWLKVSLIYHLENSIKELCQKHGYSFIDNCNVSSENLWQDGLHLNHSGKGVLLSNYVVTLNDSYFLGPSFHIVDSNSLFEFKCYEPKENACLIRENDKALNNQVQVPKLDSVDSVITNAKIGLRKMKFGLKNQI